MLSDRHCENANHEQSDADEENGFRLQCHLSVHISIGKKSSDDSKHKEYNRRTQHKLADDKLIWYIIGKAYAKGFENL